MKTIKLTILSLATLLVGADVIAQNQATGNWCKTDQHTLELQQKNPALIQQMMQLQQEARDYVDNNKDATDKAASTYIIPVVVHNITHDGGQGYVSKADIEAQLVTLNEDFNRLNSDASNTRPVFLPYAGSVDIEFRLAHLDPNGNCTEGIVRMEHASSANFSDGNKSISYWDSKKYFNKIKNFTNIIRNNIKKYFKNLNND